MHILFLTSICLLFAVRHSQSAGPNNVIRLALSKTTASTGGDLGQPLTSYYLKADVGTPPKQFRLMIDINARDHWLPHYLKLGIIYPRLNYKNGYAKKSSTTSIKEADKEYSINYDSCQLVGKAYTDILQLKDVTESFKELKFKQRFLAISSASNDRFGRRGAVDGVVSLNFWPFSVTGSEVLPATLMRHQLIKELTFALALDDDQNFSSEAKRGGELSLGGYNPTYFIGALRYHQIYSRNDAWELRLQNVLLGAVAISGSQIGNECSALISTSHNDIYGPALDVQQVLVLLGLGGEIKKDGFKTDKLYDIDCLKVATAPMLTFVIDGSHYMIPPTSYIRKRVASAIFNSQTCYVAILANQFDSNNQWILGTNFLTNFYSVFDISLRRIAFGVRK